MSMFLHVFAKSDTSIDPVAIAEMANSSWYGDGVVTAEPDETDWRRIVFTVPGIARPVVLLRDIDPATVSVMRDEQLGEHDATPQSVVDHLTAARQVLSFEVFPETLDDDVWEMLDVLESFVARELDGLVVTDDGIYGADLKRLGP